MSRAYIGMGSNIEDRLEHLRAGVLGVTAIPDTFIIGKSAVYGSVPVGVTDQPDFLNAVLSLETSLGPYELLSELHKIEIDNGRQRITRWGPRTLDLDILMFDDVQQDDPKLILPHPRLNARRFALEPLLEIAPGARLPDGTELQGILDSLGDEEATWRVADL